MARRSTLENVDAAQRPGVRARLSGEGVDPDRAEAWIVAWEAREPRDVEQRGGDYWTAGWDWIAAAAARPVVRTSTLGSEAGSSGYGNAADPEPWI